MTIEIEVGSILPNPNIDSTDSTADSIVLVPSYVMKSPSESFSKENQFTKKEFVHELQVSTPSGQIIIDKISAHIQGNIGIHFFQNYAPVVIDTSLLTDGEYSTFMEVEYLNNSIALEKKLTKVKIHTIALNEECNGTKIFSFDLASGTATNITNPFYGRRYDVGLITHRIGKYDGTPHVGELNGITIDGNAMNTSRVNCDNENTIGEY